MTGFGLAQAFSSAVPRLALDRALAGGPIRRETSPAGETVYVGIPLAGEGAARALTGIFCPEGYRAGPRADLILYLHGHKTRHPRLAIDAYWNAQRFPYWPLREGVSASGRNVLLAAPTLGPHSQAGRLIRPGGFDRYLEQVRGALPHLAAYRGAPAPPALGGVILACHSGGGYPMRQLATGSDRSASLIRECWGFDCLYNRGDEELWAKWARGRPSAKLFVYYLGSTAPKSRALARLAVPNIFVARSRAPNHNMVPITHWRERIENAAFLGARP